MSDAKDRQEQITALIIHGRRLSNSKEGFELIDELLKRARRQFTFEYSEAKLISQLEKNLDITDTRTAPYRFTTLNSKISRVHDNQHGLNVYTEGRLDAVIEVDWKVETPILIGEKHGDIIKPFKFNNEYMIPGATLRGLIRSSLETIAFGRLFQLNRHKRIAMRDFNHETYGSFLKTALGHPGLQAGWLRVFDNTAQITPCDWGFLRIQDLTSETKWKKKTRGCKYFEKRIKWRGKHAFSVPQTYRNIGPHQNRSLYTPDKNGQPGYAVFSGPAPGEKLYEYVFFDKPGATPVTLSERAWSDFNDLNTKPSKNKSTPAGAWAEYDKQGKPAGRVPIFYIGDLTHNGSSKFYFGLTRLFRIPHKHRLGDILLNHHKTHRPAEIENSQLVLKPDFIENLFGYVYEPDELEFGHVQAAGNSEYTRPNEVARKGRVAFGFARPHEKATFTLWPEKPKKTILATPNPSFAPFYLAGQEKDYSSAKSRLAGRKRYVVRKRAGEQAEEEMLKLMGDQENSNVSDDVHSHLQFLKPGHNGVFRSQIRLNNVSRAELGAVLWALTFGGDDGCRHLIGHAKPFGAGQTLVSKLTLHQRPYQCPPKMECWQHGQTNPVIQTLMQDFETGICQLLELTPDEWRNSPEIQDYLSISRPRGFDATRSTYLAFGTNGKHFKDLREKTGIGARNAPDRLLGAREGEGG